MSKLITVDWLNLRSQPIIERGNVLEIMPPDSVVERLENGATAGWFKIKYKNGQSVIEGYASEKYLQPTNLTPSEPEVIPRIAEAHLRTSRVISRSNTEGRAFQLNEPGVFKRDLKEIDNPEDRKNAIHDIINTLDVENSARYSPTTKSTYCNIYATDVANCLGLYIPRVWWNSVALVKILNGEQLDAMYDKTVVELNANSLANWFETYGTAFGWKRVLNLTTLQDTVTRGTLGVIVAQRIDLNRSGHIVAIVPEKAGLSAKRDNDKVLSPLQSQAGARNKKYFTGNNWWERPGMFRKFSFWVYDV